MCSGNLKPGCQVDAYNCSSCPGKLFRSVWKTNLEAKAGTWAWMIADEPAPTTMPPANNSAARLFRFMFAAFPTKIEKEKGAARRPPRYSRPLSKRRYLHRFGHVVEALSRFGNMADAGPGIVICEHRDLLRRQHIQHLDAAARRLLRIGVEGKLHPRLFHQQDRMVGEVGGVGKGFALRRDHEDGVADGVSRRRQSGNSG